MGLIVVTTLERKLPPILHTLLTCNAQRPLEAIHAAVELRVHTYLRGEKLDQATMAHADLAGDIPNSCTPLAQRAGCEINGPVVFSCPLCPEQQGIFEEHEVLFVGNRKTQAFA